VKSNELNEHLQRDRYGDFWLTNAVRPSIKQEVTPKQGYRIETYRDKVKSMEIPVLAAAISRENLFDAFLDLLYPLGDVVDVVLETSHESNNCDHRDLNRENIDLPVLQSHLCDFEELLLHDGCTGIAVLSTSQPIEVQFDEHKLLIIYAENLIPFELILDDYHVTQNDRLRLITEGEHLHNTSPEFTGQFESLCYRLGVAESVEQMSW